jgi:3-dehydroquinate synthase
VIACLDVLSTLHRSQLLDGLAEGIKHALIWDADLFEWIEGNWERVIHLEPWAVRYFVARNAQIKAGVVSQDVQETHLRTLLNFGHTVGHALERAAEDWHLSHGQAVAVGMLAELEIGVRMGLTQKDVWERVYRLMCKMGFARQAVQVDFDAAATALGVDKKMAAGRLKLPVVIEPGCSAIISNVAPEVLLDALRGPTG